MAVETKGSNRTIYWQGDAKVIEVDYSNDESIKHALTGVDVVISTVPVAVVHVQVKIAAAAKDAGVQLFVPSEFGGKWEARIEGMFATKANIRDQLKALDIPIAAFYTGLWADCPWVPYVSWSLGFPFRLVNHKFKATSTSMSRVGKCPLVATAMSGLRSRRDPTLLDMYPMF